MLHRKLVKGRGTNKLVMRQSNCSAPIPTPITPGTPWDITFCRVAPVFLSLYFYLAPLINHFNPLILECPTSFHLIFQCPVLFYHINLSSDPRAAPGGGMGAEQFDRLIIHLWSFCAKKVKQVNHWTPFKFQLLHVHENVENVQNCYMFMKTFS